MTANALPADRALAPAPAARRRAFSGALLLPAATALSGILTYGFLVLAARTLGPAAYGRIGVLWGTMFIVAIVVFRPLEQMIARAMSDRLARGLEVRSVVRTAVVLALGAFAVVAVATAVTWPVLERRLFRGDALLTGLLVVGVALYGGEYLVRGVLGGTRWFGGYGIGLLADAGTRLLIALPLVVVASGNLAACAVVGAGLGGALVPLLVGRRNLSVARRGGEGAPFRVAAAASFAAPAAVVAAADQLLVNGGPLLVVLSGASSTTVGVVFAATMLVRAPVFVFQGLAAALLPNFTHLHVTEDARRLRRALVGVSLGLGAIGVVVTVCGAAFGETAMRVFYGGDFVAPARSLTLLCASVGLYLVAGTISQALLATDRAAAAAVAWLLGAAVFVGGYAALPGEPLFRVALGLVLGTAAVVGALGALAFRSGQLSAPAGAAAVAGPS
jgi:O-antigen/teichoic acid export membrane protein